jgi:hypothetical protein
MVNYFCGAVCFSSSGWVVGCTSAACLLGEPLLATIAVPQYPVVGPCWGVVRELIREEEVSPQPLELPPIHDRSTRSVDGDIELKNHVKN